MSSLLRDVGEFLRRCPPEISGAPAGVVAVSGGPDSVALWRALLQLRVSGELPQPRRLVVAHLNHRLRGAESDADEAFVRHLAESSPAPAGVVYRAASLDVAGEAARRGENLEHFARSARYAWLARVAAEEGAGWVASGHTADDQAETVLHRLLRGTGLRGLRGIAPRRELAPGVWLVRPLLGTPREEVVRYLAGAGQGFRIDSSNADPRFTRNRIRAELLPLLRTFNPRAGEALARLAGEAAEAHTLLEGRTQALLREAELPPDGPARLLDRRVLAGRSRYEVREAFRLLWERARWPAGRMGFDAWDRLAGLVFGEERVVDLPGPVRARRMRGTIRVEPLGKLR